MKTRSIIVLYLLQVDYAWSEYIFALLFVPLVY